MACAHLTHDWLVAPVLLVVYATQVQQRHIKGALWKIAAGLGKFEAKTTTILGAMQVMLQDHEERIRVIERKY